MNPRETPIVPPGSRERLSRGIEQKGAKDAEGGGPMDYVLGHLKKGQIVLDEQPDWPDDQRVAVIPHLRRGVERGGLSEVAR